MAHEMLGKKTFLAEKVLNERFLKVCFESFILEVPWPCQDTTNVAAIAATDDNN